MFRSLTLGKKISIGFGICVSIILILVTVSFFGISGIVNNAGEVIDGNKLSGEFTQREVDHLNWVGGLTTLINDPNTHEFLGQVDHTKCGLGKFLYGSGRKNAEKLLPELVSTLKSMEKPHQHLHESAKKINEKYKQADAKLPTFFLEKERDHYVWISTLSDDILQKNSNVSVQLDPNKCSLGKFLKDNKLRSGAIAQNNGFLPLLKSLDKWHKKLHISAKGVDDKLKASKYDEALNSYNSITLKNLAQTKILLQKARKISENDLKGIDISKKIYVSKTTASLRSLQNLIGNAKNIIAKNIMTDEVMLIKANETKMLTIILGLIGIFLGILMSVLMIKNISSILSFVTKELGRLVESAKRGELQDRGNENDTNFEFRPIVQGINETLDGIVTPLNEVINVMDNIAAKVLTKRIEGDYSGDLAKLKLNVNTAAKNLEDAMLQVNIAGVQITSGSEQVANSSQYLSQGAQEQAASLEQINSSIEDLTKKVTESGANAKNAYTIVLSSKDNAEDGSKKMKEMVTAMDQINESSQNIAKIIKVIDSIAFQTNLLALNAAVEASRAGEHGKGFAVVAEEVRNLAAKCAKAAQETTILIEDSTAKVEQGSNFASKTEVSLNEITSGIVKVSDYIEQISNAAEDQSTGMSQILEALTQINIVTQKNAASAEESAAASEELSGQAIDLNTMVSEFELSEK
jgi:methyl-accepting chemotaxis protein